MHSLRRRVGARTNVIGYKHPDQDPRPCRRQQVALFAALPASYTGGSCDFTHTPAHLDTITETPTPDPWGMDRDTKQSTTDKPKRTTDR